MTATDPRPPISVVISSIQGWPATKRPILLAAESVRGTGGELIVADGSGRPAPSQAEVGDSVRWLKFPGQSNFQLRERAYEAATGDIVAVTEDHVVVPADWAERLIRAHAAHPEALAVGGSVENAATESTIDWASFLVVQSAVAAPIRSGRARRLSGAVNVAYKRAALEGLNDFGGLGAMDGLHQRSLLASGAVLMNDDTIRVRHDQALSFRNHTLGHFHAGRTMSGFKRRQLGIVDVIRIMGAPFVPMARYVRTVLLLAPRGYGRLLIRCTPAMLWLLYAQGLGQFIGYLFGPGDSPRRVM
jgi:hypothetical protein